MNIQYPLLLILITGISISCTNDKDVNSVEPKSSVISPLTKTIPREDLMLLSKDSLLKILPALKDDDKIFIYRELSLEYVWSWPDSAIEYSTAGLKLAEKL